MEISLRPYFLAALASASGLVMAPSAAATTAVAQSDAAVAALVRPAELVSFNYGRFANRAWELGLPRQRLGFTVTVGADGKVTDCTFTRKFRQAFVAAELCDHLKLTTRFSPALDEAGNPVSSQYTDVVQLWSIIRPNR